MALYYQLERERSTDSIESFYKVSVCKTIPENLAEYSIWIPYPAKFLSGRPNGAWAES